MNFIKYHRSNLDHNHFLFLSKLLRNYRDLSERVDLFQCTKWNFSYPCYFEIMLLLSLVSARFLFFFLVKYHLKLYLFLFYCKMGKKIDDQELTVLRYLLKVEISFQNVMVLISFRLFSPYIFFLKKIKAYFDYYLFIHHFE